MTKKEKPSGKDAADGYSVGYGRPPLHTRFKEGQSGNAKGRPKGVRNFKTDLRATLKAPVKVTREGKPRKVSTQEAALLRLREKALGGDGRALDRLIQLAQAYNNEEPPTTTGLSGDDAMLLDIYNARVLSGAAKGHSATEASENAKDSSSPDAASLAPDVERNTEQRREPEPGTALPNNDEEKTHD